MLIRNLDTAKALINGTRLRVKHLYPLTIDVEVLTGTSSGNRFLIPRIHLRASDAALPFAMQRTQFPIIPAFAMTVNKSQGQSIGKVGIMLEEPVFGHGQLYVACSRARSFEGLKFMVRDTEKQGRLRGDDRVFTRNIVFKNVV